MIVLCTLTGLTYKRKVMREGDIFDTKGGGIEKDYPEDITDEEMLRKQMKSHGEQVFRRLTEEELRKAYGEGKVDLDDMDEEQKKIIKAGVSSKIAEMRALSEQMKEEVEEEEEEEEVEEVKPGQVVQEGSESVPVKKKKDK